ncbi:MAG: Ferric uptake regulation protein FUR [uncultured Campylobacterales bacterium]|uniref:Ferric uptake regulation protein n=1 Tax=uncultured Campylobacterales bacterium TaxID=352960 RepID=A0A6S6S580_9BACT|nr:MAG: Ferric uptake regulation protein FUR [uncultured Campylobacterales bacterium]
MDKKFDKFINNFRVLIKDLGLKNSTQREIILKALFHSKAHLSAEELSTLIKKEYDSSIGIATVYRVLSFLEDHKVVSSINIGNANSKAYEINPSDHHDHIVCTKCKKVLEFFNPDLEKLQVEIANKNGFKLIDHDMILYGICAGCKK